MRCEKIEALILTDYVDGNLTGEALRELEGHLASCERCRTLAENAVTASGMFGTLKREEPPPEVWQRIQEAIGRRRRRIFSLERLFDPVGLFFARLRPVVAIGAAAALVLFILTAIRFMPPEQLRQTGPGPDDIVTAASFSDGWDEPESDFGTLLEQYFL